MKARSIGIDLIRFICILAIVGFHFLDMVYYEPDIPAYLSFSYFKYFSDYYMRFLIFAGIAIVALTTFLYGYSKSNDHKWKKLLVLFLIGHIVLAFGWGDQVFKFNLEWDIFSFLFVSFGTLYVVRNSQKMMVMLAVIGAILLSISVWEYSTVVFTKLNLPRYFQDALLGACDSTGQGMWPIFPWIGLTWLCFYLGKVMNVHSAKIKKLELAAWFFILLFTMQHISDYFHAPYAENFACFVHRRSAAAFWSQFIWLSFLVRLSLDSRLNEFLGQFRVLRWVSQLQWSVNFGRSYLYHLIVIAALSTIDFWIAKETWRFELVFITIFIVVEIMSRYTTAVFNNRKKGKLKI